MLNKRELAFDLALRTPPQFALSRSQITLASAFHGASSQKGVHGLVRPDGILRKFVAEIVQREVEARGQFERIRGSFRQIGEKAQHLRWRFEIALTVSRKQAA